MSNRAVEILLALNNQIKHVSPSKPSPFNSLTQEQPQSIDKKRGKDNIQSQITSEILQESQSIAQKHNYNQQINNEQINQTPEWLVEMLSKQIGHQITEKISELVEGILHQRQKNTYESLLGNQNSYLQALLDNTRRKDEFNINAITQLMSARNNKVDDDLQRGRIEVAPQDPKLTSKKQIELLTKLDLQRMIKIKDGELRSKLDILNQKMNSFEAVESWQGPSSTEKSINVQLHKRIAESMDAANFSLGSQKTKIARDYVRYMHQQKRLLQRRKKQRQSRYGQQQAQRQSQMNEAMQMKDLAKRQQIIQRIEQRRKKREEEQKQIQTKQQQVKSFLSEFHQKYPLFKLKQKEFYQKFVKPQQKLREQKLNQIRQNKKSMSLNEIKTHQQKYLVKLQTDKAKRQEEFKLIFKSRKAEDKIRNYYRGSAHQRINQITKQQQLRSYSMRQASKVKALRMKQYGDVIHSKHQPKLDQDKKQQIMNLIQADIMRKKKAKKVYKQYIDQTTKQVKFILQYEPLPERDYKSQGKKYFDEARKYIKKKENQNSTEIVQPQLQNSPKMESKIVLLQNSRTESQNKHKSIWHVRAKQLSQIAGSNIVDARNFEYVKHNIQNLDKKAAQREQLMKKVDFTMQQHIQQKGNLDKFYLQSIKQKIKLLQ